MEDLRIWEDMGTSWSGAITLGTPWGHARDMGTPWLSPWEQCGDTPETGTHWMGTPWKMGMWGYHEGDILGTPQVGGQGGDILRVSWAWRHGGRPPGDIFCGERGHNDTLGDMESTL